MPYSLSITAVLPIRRLSTVLRHCTAALSTLSYSDMVTAQTQIHYDKFVRALQRNSKPFDEVSELSGWLKDAVADKRVVMLGEATHGTREFYNIRAEISKILMAEHGFNFIAGEADWPGMCGNQCSHDIVSLLT